MKGFLASLGKLILGISLAFVLFSLAGVATARYFMAKLSVLPPKPIFENETVNPAIAEETATPAQPVAAPAAPPEPASPPEVEKPPGSYDAVVVQPIGLVLRSGPGTEYPQLGGVDYNEQILVLKASDDGGWINVRVTESGQEGWVKAGNTQSLTN